MNAFDGMLECGVLRMVGTLLNVLIGLEIAKRFNHEER